MSCIDEIAQNIINDCDTAPLGGMERKMWVFNRDDFDYSIDVSNNNLITAITLPIGKMGYYVEGYKKNIDAGHDLVVADTNIDKYTQYVKFTAWLQDALQTNGLDSINNLVFVVQMKNKHTDGDGALRVYGAETGLYKSSDTSRAQTEDGVRPIEFTSLAGEESKVSSHVFFETDLSTSIAALDALLIAQA